MDRRSGIIRCLPGMLLLLVLAAAAAGLQVHAAFPDDLEEKNVVAEPLQPDAVMIYRDSAREELRDVVPGKGFSISISMVKGDSLFGSYESGDLQGTGWISSDTVLTDPAFEHVYATVRAKMTIYTDASCKEKKTTIRKYSGVILTGREGNSRQVIYDKGDHYGIGWMKRKEYANNLKYDGRPKQILADGAYHFRCGYQDDASGGPENQTGMERYPEHIFQLTHADHNCYTIRDRQTGKYLRVKPDRNRKKMSLVWEDDPDDYNGRFLIRRINGSFTIMNTVTETHYAQNEKGEDLLAADAEEDNTHWRPVAVGRMVDEDRPFVFTQYDPQWCATPYGSEGCMGTAGCGILAPVNAVYALSGQYMDVMELADYAVEEEYRIVGSGTADGVFEAIARKFGRKYGFAWDGKGEKLKTLKKKLQEGKTAVSHVEGHYVCICAYDEKTDRYLLLDSNCLPKRQDTPFGDWISPERLQEGTLASQGYFFYKLSEK